MLKIKGIDSLNSPSINMITTTNIYRNNIAFPYDHFHNDATHISSGFLTSAGTPKASTPFASI